MMDLESSEEGKISSEGKLVGGTLSGDTEAAISRDTFEGMLETLSRKKKSIGRASCHAIDCAKYSLFVEVSLISIIFQYGKHATHFIFAYCGFYTFRKLMMKFSRIRVKNEYLACGSFMHS